MTRTFFPASASATARLQDVSVFPVPPFGPRTQTRRASRSPWPAAAPLARCPRDRLAHDEPELLLRLGEQRHVCGSDVERPTQEAVGRRRREDDDRQAGICPVCAVDDLERTVVLGALARDQQHVDVTALERSDRVVDTVGHPDELEVRVVGHGSLHVEGVQAFDGDECADGLLHGVSYFLSCDVISCWSCWVEIAFFGGFFASPAGRRRNHMDPVSAASATRLSKRRRRAGGSPGRRRPSARA